MPTKSTVSQKILTNGILPNYNVIAVSIENGNMYSLTVYTVEELQNFTFSEFDYVTDFLVVEDGQYVQYILDYSDFDENAEAAVPTIPSDATQEEIKEYYGIQ